MAWRAPTAGCRIFLPLGTSLSFEAEVVKKLERERRRRRRLRSTYLGVGEQRPRAASFYLLPRGLVLGHARHREVKDVVEGDCVAAGLVEFLEGDEAVETVPRLRKRKDPSVRVATAP
jgi:hypothetical protein